MAFRAGGDTWAGLAVPPYLRQAQPIRYLAGRLSRSGRERSAADGSGPAGVSTFTYDENEIDSRVVSARRFTDEKVVAAGAGYYFSNVLG